MHSDQTSVLQEQLHILDQALLLHQNKLQGLLCRCGLYLGIWTCRNGLNVFLDRYHPIFSSTLCRAISRTAWLWRLYHRAQHVYTQFWQFVPKILSDLYPLNRGWNKAVRLYSVMDCR
ncbi:hypothetical protein D3C81_1135730 [compost metagenome]